jgi:putative FmdB family regulatory protein
MPVYEYHCNTCGETFEKLVRLSEIERLPECPECGSPDTSKRISLLARSSFTGAAASQSAASSCSAPAGRGFR